MTVATSSHSDLFLLSYRGTYMKYFLTALLIFFLRVSINFTFAISRDTGNGFNWQNTQLKIQKPELLQSSSASRKFCYHKLRHRGTKQHKNSVSSKVSGCQALLDRFLYVRLSIAQFVTFISYLCSKVLSAACYGLSIHYTQICAMGFQYPCFLYPRKRQSGMK